ncbi:MAG: hypothetical protein JNK82_09170 [Myxococcaceae bacterium]|nr:hypothetical protein [Myxococcaceae bacterium]
MRRGAHTFILSLLCAGACSWETSERTFACADDGQCADGFRCVAGVCSDEAAAGGAAGGQSGAGGSAAGSSGGAAGGSTAGGAGLVITSLVPVAVTAPSLDFSPDGSVVADDGTWAAADGGPISVTRRWLRCPADGGTCVAITTAASLTGTNVQNDATRTSAVDGDGLQAGSGTGVWGATTNVAPNGGLETNTTSWGVWSSGAMSANFPLTSRTTAEAKFGSYSMRAISNGVDPAQSTLQRAPVSPSTLYTMSGWVKTTPGARHCIAVDQFDAAGAYVDSFNGPAVTGNGSWQRLTATGTTEATTVRVHVLFRTCAAMGQAVTWYVDGVQTETGAIATPYVETSAGEATRPASDLTAPSQHLDVEQGWAAVRVRPRWDATTARHEYPSVLQLETSTANKLHLYFYRDGSSWRLERNLTAQHLIGVGAAPAPGVAATLVAAWARRSHQLSVGAGPWERSTESEVPSPVPATFSLAGLDGEVLWAALGRARLDDPELQALNAPGDLRPTFEALPGRPVFLWRGDSLAYEAAVTAATYAPQPADVGSTLVLEVTATNDNGSTTVRSAAFFP